MGPPPGQRVGAELGQGLDWRSFTGAGLRYFSLHMPEDPDRARLTRAGCAIFPASRQDAANLAQRPSVCNIPAAYQCVEMQPILRSSGRPCASQPEPLGFWAWPCLLALGSWGTASGPGVMRIAALAALSQRPRRTRAWTYPRVSGWLEAFDDVSWSAARDARSWRRSLDGDPGSAVYTIMTRPGSAVMASSS